MKEKDYMLSVGQNSKLGKKIGVFNLPQGRTCPGKTALCAKICYAAKAERIRKFVSAKRKRNLQASMGSYFIQNMINEIRKRKLTMIRIHESGDFYNQEYLGSWMAIAFNLPEVKFLAYTKSFHLDFKAAPKNMCIIWSVDATTATKPPAGPQAYIVQKGEAIPAGSYTCITGPHKEHYCGSYCKLCWNAKANGKVNIYFDQH